MTTKSAGNCIIGLQADWPHRIGWELYKLRLQAQGDLVDVPDTVRLSSRWYFTEANRIGMRLSGWQPYTTTTTYPI